MEQAHHVCGNKFSEVICMLALHSKYTRALTAENLCQGLADTLLPQVSNLALQAQAKKILKRPVYSDFL